MKAIIISGIMIGLITIGALTKNPWLIILSLTGLTMTLITKASIPKQEPSIYEPQDLVAYPWKQR